MDRIDGYDHTTGIHCGSTALQNVATHYGFQYSEPACFGIGGGVGFIQYAPTQPLQRVRLTPPWLESAFFERLGIPHRRQAPRAFSTAWARLTDHLAENDPVILFLEPSALPYLDDSMIHVPPHTAVAIGHDPTTDAILLSDGAAKRPQRIDRSTLQEAWHTVGVPQLHNEYLVVTRPAQTTATTTAVATGLRATATRMLQPQTIDRDLRGASTNGIDAIETTLSNVDGSVSALALGRFVQLLTSSADGHAFRSLYARSLDELGQYAGLAPTLAADMASIADRWDRIATQLRTLVNGSQLPPATIQEVRALLRTTSNRERAVFTDLRDSL